MANFIEEDAKFNEDPIELLGSEERQLINDDGSRKNSQTINPQNNVPYAIAAYILVAMICLAFCWPLYVYIQKQTWFIDPTYPKIPKSAYQPNTNAHVWLALVWTVICGLQPTLILLSPSSDSLARRLHRAVGYIAIGILYVMLMFAAIAYSKRVCSLPKGCDIEITVTIFSGIVIYAIFVVVAVLKARNKDHASHKDMMVTLIAMTSTAGLSRAFSWSLSWWMMDDSRDECPSALFTEKNRYVDVGLAITFFVLFLVLSTLFLYTKRWTVFTKATTAVFLFITVYKAIGVQFDDNDMCYSHEVIANYMNISSV